MTREARQYIGIALRTIIFSFAAFGVYRETGILTALALAFLFIMIELLYATVVELSEIESINTETLEEVSRWSDELNDAILSVMKGHMTLVKMIEDLKAANATEAEK